MAYAPLPRGFAAGNPGVTYDDAGRLQYNTGPPGAMGGVSGPTGVRTNFFWRSQESTPVQQNVRTRWSFLPWNRGAPAPPPAAQIATRTRFDDYTILPGMVGYREVRPPVTGMVTEQRRVTLPPSRTDQLVVEEMKIYNQRPPWWWLFIVLGILLIILGIINILFCVEKHHYCRFWTGVCLIIFGIVGAIHMGDYYRRKWKSWLYIIVGTITAGVVFACLAFAMETFCHQLIEIAQFNDKDGYIDEMKFRYNYLHIKPKILIKNDVEHNIWLCFALDAVALVVLTVAFLVPTAVCYVIDRFYNSNWVITRRVEPFCEPQIFNPWGQVSWGSAMIYIGMVVNASVHGNRIRSWQHTYSPVWSGAIPMIAGVFTALALKSCGLQSCGRKLWNFLAIILELLSAIVSIIGIIFMLVGMIENIETLKQSKVMTFTSFTHRMMFASVILFCIGMLSCLVNVVWSLALLIRLIYCFCCSRDNREVSVQYIYDDPAYYKDERKVYTDRPGGVWERDVRPGEYWDREARIHHYDDTFVDNPYAMNREVRTYRVD